MLLFFPSQPGRILQARQNFASQNFCLGSQERFGAEQNQIPEFPHALFFAAFSTLVHDLDSWSGLSKQVCNLLPLVGCQEARESTLELWKSGCDGRQTTQFIFKFRNSL
jgi:hypothetical protein